MPFKNNSSVFVVFKDELPKRNQEWWQNLDTVIEEMKPVVDVTIFPDDQTPGHIDLLLLGQFQHPVYCLPVHIFSKLVSPHGKAGGKGFR